MQSTRPLRRSLFADKEGTEPHTDLTRIDLLCNEVLTPPPSPESISPGWPPGLPPSSPPGSLAMDRWSPLPSPAMSRAPTPWSLLAHPGPSTDWSLTLLERAACNADEEEGAEGKRE